MKIIQEIRQYDDNFMVWYSHYNNMSFLPHWHREIELIRVKSGKASINIADQGFLAEEGDLIICDSNLIHYSDSQQFSNILEFIVFDLSLVQTVRYIDRFKIPHIRYDDLEKYGLKDITERLFSEVPIELKDKHQYYQEIIKGLLREFWYKARRAIPVEKPTLKEKKHMESERVFHEVLSFLESHCHEDIPLAKIAGLFNFSECYFSRCFKTYTGLNYVTYMNLLRIESAINKLINTNLPVAMIALECGFNDIRHFNRVFRKYTGHTPSEFRSNTELGTYTLSFPHRRKSDQLFVVNDSPVVLTK